MQLTSTSVDVIKKNSKLESKEKKKKKVHSLKTGAKKKKKNREATSCKEARTSQTEQLSSFWQEHHNYNYKEDTLLYSTLCFIKKISQFRHFLIILTWASSLPIT